MNKVLKVDKLRKEFGGLVAVKDVSFEVNKGEFIGIYGRIEEPGITNFSGLLRSNFMYPFKLFLDIFIILKLFGTFFIK